MSDEQNDPSRFRELVEEAFTECPQLLNDGETNEITLEVDVTTGGYIRKLAVKNRASIQYKSN